MLTSAYASNSRHAAWTSFGFLGIKAQDVRLSTFHLDEAIWLDAPIF